MERLTLRQMRLMKDMTQRELAEIMGVNVNTYCAWEKCPAKIQAGHLLKVLSILGYSIRDLKLFNDNGSAYMEKGE